MTGITNVPVYPHDEPDKYLWVAFVIDGEVAVKMPFPFGNESFTAAFQSDPKVVILSGEDRTNVLPGFVFNGTNFVNPNL
jgi:hypothetical protein